MINLFYRLCKSLLKRLTDETIFVEATNGFKHINGICPRCGAKGKFKSYGDYSRSLVSVTSGKVTSSNIRPHRYQCVSCSTTHALLPDIIIPHSPYSLRFKLEVLTAYYKRDITVETICNNYGIAVSTIYAWMKRLLEHKELLLGVLVSLREPALAFLLGLFESISLSDRLRDFYRRHGFIFFHKRTIQASRSRPP